MFLRNLNIYVQELRGPPSRIAGPKEVDGREILSIGNRNELALESKSTLRVTESIRNLPRCKAGPAHKADNLTSFCELTI
jgi:hypothetical protein